MSTRQRSRSRWIINHWTDDPFRQAVVEGVEDGRRNVADHVWRKIGRVVAAFVCVMLVCGAAYSWVGVHGRQAEQARRDVSACMSYASGMADAYDKSVRALAEAKRTFASMDESYDLDALSQVVDMNVGRSPSIDCSSDPERGRRKAEKLAKAYGNQYRNFRQALRKKK